MGQFYSPFLNLHWKNNDSITDLGKLVAENLNEIISSYPVFRGFTHPSFYQGKIFQSSKAPNIEAIRKTCQTDSPREVSFIKAADKWLIIVGETGAYAETPLELSCAPKDKIRYLAHTHPGNEEENVYPSFIDLNNLAAAEFVFSKAGVFRMEPPSSDFTEKASSCSAHELFAYYVNNYKKLSESQYEKIGAWKVFEDFITEVYNYRYVSWNNKNEIRELLSSDFPAESFQKRRRS